MVPNTQTGTALVSPDLEFYTKVIVILLASILFFQLFQWWSMPTPSCPYSEALVRLISQLKNPEIADLLRQKQSQEVQRSIGHLSEQLNELMSLMRVRDEL
ncbi:hypothetical protein L596_010265 [Steinernema carpocapsae]|uniref:Uncharacterized protein n=1 Tax=Steinernema carpocapsae TaxID=34508 RepID=A0A4U5PHV3_STECR|nr:hypothetical protein L596_010265 [Steinernema carpocapsae]